jgi:aryl-alcohol dehydrogenase-like predicted oxidoreductase
MTVPTTELAPGYTISRLIKGGWQLAGGHGPVEHQAALDDMTAYVEAGLTTFDCADIYTGVEALIGAWRSSAPAELRAQLRVHTKFVPDLDMLDRLTRADVRRMITRSITRLAAERLDLVQFSWWDLTRGDPLEVAGWLAELQTEGLIELVGGTNFDAAHTAAWQATGAPVATMQVQYSLLDQRPAGALSALCAQTGLRLLCYGTLAGGFFGERWLGAAAPQEFENRSLVKYFLIIEECGGWDFFQALLAVLARVGQRHGAGIGAMATRMVLDFPHVAAAIVGVRSPAHLAAHRGLCDIVPSAADRAEIAAVLAQARPVPGEVYALERDRTGRHGRIMKYDLAKD